MKWFIVAACICTNYTALYSKDRKKTETFYQELAQRIWRNESGCSTEKLVWWNEGESFMSLGIGHFLWFPKGSSAPFTQTFPLLLQFMKQHGQTMPEWLEKTQDYCPWNNREQVINKLFDVRLQELRSFLEKTITLQAQFIAHRFETARNTILATVPRCTRTCIKSYIATLSETPQGLYALIDYVNFKGDGTNPQERYKTHGWGLLQVLTTIDATEFKNDPQKAFVSAAHTILTQRVKNSPPERNEKRWLAGWINRINRYCA
jgi:hypothetical protein